MANLNFKRISPASIAPTPIPEPIILDDSKASHEIIQNEILRLNAEEAIGDALVDRSPPSPEIITREELGEEAESKLSALISDDFPFDASQLEAINGIVAHRFACMTGAAGTGKTTCTKKIVSEIQHDVGLVDMKDYFKRTESGTDEHDALMDARNAAADPDDDYQLPESAIPSIVLCGFTGRSTQMIKKNFPRDWHGNIMTIHRLLAYMPERFEVYDESTEEMRESMRFVPTYTADNKLPWNTIIIDEAGMLGLELWHNLFAAMREGTRVIMIGDINQLPPVHGKSIFGFALGAWPAWELTHVHRQEGVNNSIVDNAWRVIHGQRTVSDIPLDLNIESKTGIVDAVNALLTTSDWKFAKIKVPEDSRQAAIRIRQFMGVAKDRFYDPIRDSIITATNGENEASVGAILGQLPMNQELAILLNKDHERYIIDAGRDKRRFAVGDKVMATKNDHEAGITNGMTGTIEEINRHAGYAGDFRRFGLISEVKAYLADLEEDGDDEEISLEELHESLLAQEDAKSEKRDRGPASHIVTIRFGEGEHSFTQAFDTLAAVGSLMTAYVVTCHKMQGGESPLVATICHNHHRAMLFREWLYTALTRASAKAILFYTDLGEKIALSKQRIKGKTMMEKVESFQESQRVGLLGSSVNVRIQKPVFMDGSSWNRSDQVLSLHGAGGNEFVEKTQVSTGLMEMMNKAKSRLEAPSTEPNGSPAQAMPQPSSTPPTSPFAKMVERTIHHHHYHQADSVGEQSVKPATVAGGTLRNQNLREQDIPINKFSLTTPKMIADRKAQVAKMAASMLPARVPTHTPEQLLALARFVERPKQLLLLTHQPAPVTVAPVVKTIQYRGLAALLNRGK